MTYKLNFDLPLEFKPQNYKNLGGVVGIYFIFLKEKSVTYPFRDSRLIYIGMSERKTNSIASRLSNHFDGKSGNLGLQNYQKISDVMFTYLNFDVIKTIWKYRIEDFESYLLLDFVEKFGVYPICNNKTGFPELDDSYKGIITIDWDYFN
jgi:hypothetical protein